VRSRAGRVELRDEGCHGRYDDNPTGPAASGELLIIASFRLAELIGVLSLGQDSAFGQPLESQLRSTLLAGWLADAMGLPTQDRETTYWVAQLRYVGCTGHAHEVALLFGDEIETRARTLLYDAADPFAVMRDVLGHAQPARRGIARVGAVLSLLAGGRRFAEMNFRTGCEVTDLIVARLGMDDAVRHSLRHTFERWNGRGQPGAVRGKAIPLPMRIVHLTHDMEALARLRGPAEALRLAQDRTGRTYDPDVVDVFLRVARDLFDQLDKVDPWDAVLAAEPTPHRLLDGPVLDDALAIVADFTDLKSPHTAGHSRGVADLAEAACEHAGLGRDDAVAARRAALVHDLGRTGIPNSIWDKPSRLTRAELDRVQLHPLLTEQMLRRSPTLAALSPIAACHHERADGTGYAKGLTTSDMAPAARIVAAADRYQAMTEPRAHRPALSPSAAMAELRRMAGENHVDRDAA
jgi:HD-GYP domain-containing protein (c-di-GMP phosphodiesterase class II)